ncbi:hypothetical protein AZ09_03810 [Acetobacter aceti 1023]|nr:hypothetical protein AZ09_03810 [Acetobacter aceti 1023]
MTYILDSNVFIQAKNSYYGFDICPGFWTWLDTEGQKKKIVFLSMVCDELIDGNDDLAEWAKSRQHVVWRQDVDDEITQKNFSRIAASVMSGPYKQTAKEHFLSKADPWLVAKAMTIGGTVVTHETPNVTSFRRVPLPNICTDFQVPWINTFELLRSKGVVFR